MAFDLDPDYKQVPERIRDFKEKHPEGSLRPLNPEKPYDIVEVAGQTFIVYCAAAFRHPEDPAPGVGTAWELVPGKTPYTKLSELQNAETSAWGRAIVAVLASESKSIASAEDVRNRKADHAPVSHEPTLFAGWADLAEQDAAHKDFRETVAACGEDVQAHMRDFRKDRGFGWPMSREQLDEMLEQLASAQTVLAVDDEEARTARAIEVAEAEGLTDRVAALKKKQVEQRERRQGTDQKKVSAGDAA